ncbi:LysR substrate-binding domain-containing protein [Leucobacter allii]|uniref:LysR substrate-binding domain-containing protein n=1 Tax=Leucobacter allii TaxID=2932247 RepID=A0ABY4FJ26_9MICO|nr:LysR substrate-binding domain-containing protein [Leucobacter allii]UOQ56028.1 LysR substrate-binding domain-containing protein [Leucobacter allii]
MSTVRPPDFTLRQLAYLVAAAEAGSIAAAAERLHVSPSALSEALTELERALGAPLTVRRRAHGLTLTGSGTAVLARARRLLDGAAELAAGIRGPDGELAGPVTIACYPTLAPVILPALLDGFGRAHPRVQLDILEVTHDQLRGRIESGEVDVAFVYDTLVPGAPRRERLYALPAHVILPAGHRLAGAESVRLADLASDDLILLDAPPSSEHTLSLFARLGVTPRIRHRTASYEAVRTLVGRGLGYGVLVQRVANDRSYEGYPIVAKEIEPPVEPVGIDVIWAAGAPPSARVQRLVAFARSIDWHGAAPAAGGAP